MADLPILFSASMVQANLREIAQPGTGKTQTRRTFSKLRRFGAIREFGVSDTPGYAWHFRDREGRWHDLRDRELFEFLPYKIGDRLYVREHWSVSQNHDETKPRLLPKQRMTVFFDAGGSIANQASGKWEPDNNYPTQRPDWLGRNRQSMHMPRWASRITLIVTDVRVERLNDISDADAFAEGISTDNPRAGIEVDIDGQWWAGAARARYRTVWETINGAGSWGINPWVIAYTYRPLLGNIDQIEVAA